MARARERQERNLLTLQMKRANASMLRRSRAADTVFTAMALDLAAARDYFAEVESIAHKARTVRDPRGVIRDALRIMARQPASLRQLGLMALFKPRDARTVEPEPGRIDVIARKEKTLV